MEPRPEKEKQPPALQIYFLPNLMTAGNLFCGFVALTRIVEPNITQGDIKMALAYILLACIFDLLDGRLARMGGVESAFGREFDSLADLISFGAAPAFLIHRVVLRQVFSNQPEIGWFIASIYLICGALRLARFNCLAAMPGGGGGKEFLGFPIPAAAGLVASLTLFLLWGDQTDRDLAHPPWSFILPGLLLFLSVMMVSEVKYPSFKTLDLRARRTFAKTIIAIIFAAALVILRRLILPIVLPIMFILYLLYGFIRPRISRKVRHEIEEEDDEEEQTGLTP
ncbi:MAG TPA: CDP-diacylglycerol--serine O-phosphatidyltransferase [Verrucomicrobiae bacterium]|jgi:CDP-diacylglycerol--serine O-phosphatidyltransferase|nr:CDP-diacylglycerol--serine O-phosphatidyltransferase [Verrucomicrobiae bacterium]